jgi:hypothetical protein
MLRLSTGSVHGYHRRKAEEAGTMWVIHWVNGSRSPVMDTHKVFREAQGKHSSIEWVENVSMRPYIDKCLKVMRAGHKFPSYNHSGCELLYRENDYYIGDRLIDELVVRRDLQNYYTMTNGTLEEDTPYIEERLIQIS